MMRWMVLSLCLVTGCAPQSSVDGLSAERDQLAAKNAELAKQVESSQAQQGKLSRQLKGAEMALKGAEGTLRSVRASSALEELGISKGQRLSATFQTSKGDIHCELFPELAPVTVLNFVGLSEGTKEWTHPDTHEKMSAPLYDNTVFHRVIAKFMIQGGDPRGTGTGGPGYNFEDEFTSELRFDKPGLLAMANRGPGTNGSQFFITDSTPAHLNGKHTIFGRCDDLDVVRAIISVPKSRRDVPIEPVALKHIQINRE